MEHEKAVETKASERYLLDEMNEAERLAFEAHYFECETCAQDVRAGELLVRGIRQIGGDLPEPALGSPQQKVTRSWRDWLFPGSLVPSAAALAMTVIVAYQTFVVIPPLRETARPQAVEPVVLRAVARGEEPVIQVARAAGVSVLTLDVNTGEPGQELRWKISPPSGASITGTAKTPPAGSQLQLWIPNSNLQHSGSWSLILENSQGAEVGRYPFQIQIAK